MPNLNTQLHILSISCRLGYNYVINTNLFGRLEALMQQYQTKRIEQYVSDSVDNVDISR